MSKSYKRHIAKTLTWRFIGTIDTIVLSWIISGNATTGLQIGLAEVITKMLLYYLHERVWFRLKLKNASEESSKRRHIFKTITWRIVGTIDTMLLAWLISGNALVGLKIGVVEVITKMILYYFHERLWYKFDYGVASLRRNEEKS